MVKKGHRKMQKETPLINDWDVVLWQMLRPPTRKDIMYKKVSTDMNFVDREKETEKFWEETITF